MANCSFPNCNLYASHDGYCPGHYRMMHAVPVDVRKPIQKRSDKMKDEMKQYKPMVTEFLNRPENQGCKIQSPVCTVKATCVNHKKRRGKNLMNEKYFESSCGPCNNYIEAHPAWALEHGHLISVHQIEKQ